MPDNDDVRSELPFNAGGETETRDSLREDAINEGLEAAEGGISTEEMTPEAEEELLTEIAESVPKDQDLGIDELRQIPGSEKYSDEDLKAEWEKAKAEAVSASWQPPFPLFDDKGEKIKDFSKVTLQDFMSGKYQVEYKALGKEQRKAYSDIVRTAQNGHFNEQRYNTVVQERNQVAQEVGSLRDQVKSFDGQQRTWLAALNAFANGNIEPMKALATRLIEESAKMPISVPGMVSEDQVKADRELMERGVTFANEYVLPKVVETAQLYGSNVQETVQWVKWRIAQEGSFLTREKVDQILGYELPMQLEAYGMQPKTGTGGPVDTSKPNNGENDALKKQIAELQASVAKLANGKTDAVRNKARRIPPAGGGVTSGAGDSMPNFKNRDEMKEYLRS